MPRDGPHAQMAWLLANLVWIGFLLATVGVVLAALAWRGRRVDDHLICKKCRFDLVGLDAPITCPECGTGLREPGAVRVGNRTRSRSLILASILIMLVCLGLVALGIAGSLPDLTRHKPVALLMFEATNSTANTQRTALDELTRRQAAGEFSTKQWDGIVADLLAHAEADDAEPDPAIGTTMLVATKNGWLSRADVERVFDEWYEVTLEVPPRLRIGGPMQARVSYRTIADTPLSNIRPAGMMMLGTFRIGPDATRAGIGGIGLYTKGASTWTLPAGWWETDDAKPGEASVTQEIDVTLGGYTLRTRTLETTTELAPHDAPFMVELISDRSTDAAMRAAMQTWHKEPMRFATNPDRALPALICHIPRIRVVAGEAPLEAIAHRVLFVWDKGIVDFGEITPSWVGFGPGPYTFKVVTWSRLSTHARLAAVRSALPAKGDLFLLPLADGPARTEGRFGVDKVWAGTAVFRGVEIRVDVGTELTPPPGGEVGASTPSESELKRVEAWLAQQHQAGEAPP